MRGAQACCTVCERLFDTITNGERGGDMREKSAMLRRVMICARMLQAKAARERDNMPRRSVLRVAEARRERAHGGAKIRLYDSARQRAYTMINMMITSPRAMMKMRRGAACWRMRGDDAKCQYAQQARLLKISLCQRHEYSIRVKRRVRAL